MGGFQVVIAYPTLGLQVIEVRYQAVTQQYDVQWLQALAGRIDPATLSGEPVSATPAVITLSLRLRMGCVDNARGAYERVRRDVAGSAGVALAIVTHLNSGTETWEYTIGDMATSSTAGSARAMFGEDPSSASVTGSMDLARGDDLTALFAADVSDAAQLVRWHQGLDPAWPPCYLHLGQHPLITYGGIDTERWRCPRAPTAQTQPWPRYGELTEAMLSWGLAPEAGSLEIVGRRPWD